MKLAFSTLACPGWSWKQAIDAAKSYGYDGIEWRLIDGQIANSQYPLAVCEQIKEAVAKAGLVTCALDSGVSLAFPPGPDRDRQLDEARGMLKLAAALDTDMVRMFPGKYPQSASDEEAIGWVVEGARALVPEAKDLGVRIALEIHDSFDWKRRELRGTTASWFTAEALKLVDSAEVGILWDLGNPYLEGEGPRQAFENVRARMNHVHTKDMRPTPEGGWQYVLMGEGVIPIPDVLAWLKDCGYDGWLSFEWEKKWHPELAEPEVSLPQYAEYMRVLLGRG